MTGGLEAFDRAVEDAYVPQIIAQGRSCRNGIAKVLGVDWPPEPAGLTDVELAYWYLDLMDAGT